jgi:mannose/fructose/N-acetylgalactosamine-specific phosphotransferase system component IIC
MQWENITDYYYAWAIYAAGAVGCSVAAWLFFRGLPRALVHFFVVTVMVLLFTPFAIDSNTMIMAPAIVCLGYGFFAEGFVSVKPVLKTLIAVWAVAMVLSLVYQLLTHKWYKAKKAAQLNPPVDEVPEEAGYTKERAEPVISSRHTTDENASGEPPIRAER